MHVVVCRSCVLDCEAEYELKGFCWQVASVYSAGLLETGSRGLVIDLHTEKKVPAVLQDFGPISEDVFQLRCPLQINNNKCIENRDKHELKNLHEYHQDLPFQD